MAESRDLGWWQKGVLRLTSSSNLLAKRWWSRQFEILSSTFPYDLAGRALCIPEQSVKETATGNFLSAGYLCSMLKKNWCWTGLLAFCCDNSTSFIYLFIWHFYMTTHLTRVWLWAAHNNELYFLDILWHAHHIRYHTNGIWYYIKPGMHLYYSFRKFTEWPLTLQSILSHVGLIKDNRQQKIDSFFRCRQDFIKCLLTCIKTRNQSLWGTHTIPKSLTSNVVKKRSGFFGASWIIRII